MHAFFNVLFHIDALETALQYHKMAGERLPYAAPISKLSQSTSSRKSDVESVTVTGKSLTPSELKRIVRKISSIDLPEDVLFVAVSMFDENGVSQIVLLLLMTLSLHH